MSNRNKGKFSTWTVCLWFIIMILVMKWEKRVFLRMKTSIRDDNVLWRKRCLLVGICNHHGCLVLSTCVIIKNREFCLDGLVLFLNFLCINPLLYNRSQVDYFYFFHLAHNCILVIKYVEHIFFNLCSACPWLVPWVIQKLIDSLCSSFYTYSALVLYHGSVLVSDL